MRSLRTRLAVTTIALAAALATSACNDEDDRGTVSADGDGASPSTTAQTSSSEPSEQSEDETEEAEPSPTDESSADVLSTADCLPGNWFVDNDEFGALMSTVSGSAVDNISGSTMVTFRDDGTTTTHYDEWTHTITVKSATVTIVKNGEDSGTYEIADDGTMTLTDTDLASTTTSQMKMGGRTINQPVPPQKSVFSRATFTCAGDELTVTAEGATTVLHREH
ncbi:MAG: hypothetical protein L0H31_02910 [Nocardioidaceae bacterium]|nr:hypothetical protein [Nocardioidaceae bacterium]